MPASIRGPRSSLIAPAMAAGIGSRALPLPSAPVLMPILAPVLALILALILALVLALVLPGCGPSGEGSYARWSTLEVPEGGYSLRYLSPPWEVASVEGASAHLYVESGAMRLFPDAGLPGKYELSVRPLSGQPEVLAAAVVGTATAAGQEVVLGPRIIPGGWDVVTQQVELERHFRYVFLDHPAGSLRMVFEATPLLDTEEINAMIRGVEMDAP